MNEFVTVVRVLAELVRTVMLVLILVVLAWSACVHTSQIRPATVRDVR